MNKRKISLNSFFSAIFHYSLRFFWLYCNCEMICPCNCESNRSLSCTCFQGVHPGVEPTVNKAQDIRGYGPVRRRLVGPLLKIWVFRYKSLQKIQWFVAPSFAIYF